jgi:hypothetical protein
LRNEFLFDDVPVRRNLTLLYERVREHQCTSFSQVAPAPPSLVALARTRLMKRKRIKLTLKPSSLIRSMLIYRTLEVFQSRWRGERGESEVQVERKLSEDADFARPQSRFTPRIRDRCSTALAKYRLGRDDRERVSRGFRNRSQISLAFPSRERWSRNDMTVVREA